MKYVDNTFNPLITLSAFIWFQIWILPENQMNALNNPIWHIAITKNTNIGKMYLLLGGIRKPYHLATETSWISIEKHPDLKKHLCAHRALLMQSIQPKHKKHTQEELKALLPQNKKENENVRLLI